MAEANYIWYLTLDRLWTNLYDTVNHIAESDHELQRKIREAAGEE